jgi:hypothetical protein
LIFADAWRKYAALAGVAVCALDFLEIIGIYFARFAETQRSPSERLIDVTKSFPIGPYCDDHSHWGNLFYLARVIRNATSCNASPKAIANRAERPICGNNR